MEALERDPKKFYIEEKSFELPKVVKMEIMKSLMPKQEYESASNDHDEDLN